ncbi:hypothetical protein MKX03_024353 [Papaver bracteatum]|nr:hypothetical protein MKX03_024353 [Papaver bracteatum]
MKPKRTNFSKYLLALLSYGGVPDEYFLDLLFNCLKENKNFQCDRRAAFRASLYYGGIDDFLITKMILCGIPLGEPYLKERLSVLMREDLKNLKEGKLPVNDSYSLMGTADPTGILQPDQVCVILFRGCIILQTSWPTLWRHTSPDCNICERVEEDAKYGIFFPIVGPRSIADEIANSDLDGDMYWVCRNTEVSCHGHKNVSHLKPTDFHDEDELEHHLFEQYLTARFSSNPVGEAATYWLRLMDRRLTIDKSDAEKIKEVEGKLLHLTDIYYDALDAAKSGKKVQIPPKLKQHETPHFMQKMPSGPSGLNKSPQSRRKDNYYRSKSVLGLLYDAVESYEDQQVVVDKLTSFEQDVPEACIAFWREQHKSYKTDMSPELNQSRRKAKDIYMDALAIYHICYDEAKHYGVKKCYFYYLGMQNDRTFMCSESALREILNINS